MGKPKKYPALIKEIVAEQSLTVSQKVKLLMEIMERYSDLQLRNAIRRIKKRRKNL